MGAELIYPGNPVGIGVPGSVLQGSPWWLDEDTRLQLTAVNTAPGVVLAINGLRLDASGQQQPIAESTTIASDRTRTIARFQLGKGILQRLTVVAAQGTPIFGQCYVLVQLIRGISGQVTVLATIAGGNVTAGQSLSFPISPVRSSVESGGYLRMVVGTAPAAGVEIFEQCPGNARWEVLALNVQLNTSNVVNVRRVRIFFNNSGRVPSFVVATNGVDHNSVLNYDFMQNMPTHGTITFSDGHQYGTEAIPLGSLLLANDSWSTHTDLLDAGDQYAQPTYLVKETLDF